MRLRRGLILVLGRAKGLVWGKVEEVVVWEEADVGVIETGNSLKSFKLFFS
jgi:hypothetical protein